MKDIQSVKAAEEAVKILFEKVEKVIGETSYISVNGDVMKIDLNTIRNYTGDFVVTSENPLIDTNAEYLCSAGIEFYSRMKGICSSHHMDVAVSKKDNSFDITLGMRKEISDTELPCEIRRQVEIICGNSYEYEAPCVPSDVTYFKDGEASVHIAPLAVYSKNSYPAETGVNVYSYLNSPGRFNDTYFLGLGTEDLEFPLKSKENETLDFFREHLGCGEWVTFYMKSDKKTGVTTFSGNVYKRLAHTF